MVRITHTQEIELLRNSTALIRQAIAAVKKVQFSPCNEEAAEYITDIENSLHDSGIDDLETDEECRERKKNDDDEATYEEQRQSDYYASVL